jgi:hypothetical protein
VAYFKRVHVNVRQAVEDETVEVGGVLQAVRRGTWIVTNERDGRVRLFGRVAFDREFVYRPDEN